MKFLPRTKKQILTTSIVAIAIVGLAGVSVNALLPTQQSNNKASVSETEKPVQIVKDQEIVSDIETTAPTEEVTNEPAPVQTTPPVQNEPIKQEPVKDTRLDSMCASTLDFITTRFVNKKDASGNPWYQSSDVMLTDLKRQNPAMFSFYNECVTAGKFAAL
jgi:hypothetical protein